MHVPIEGTGYKRCSAAPLAERRYAGSDATITAEGQTMLVSAETIDTKAIRVYARLAPYACLSGKV
jgi:hypothetical protein